TDLLRHVWMAIAADGWRLENADITIVTAEPRLAGYRVRMRQALSGALDCPLELISVKATTTDGLGFIGRTEGVLASAVVLLSS
ncbi:MAG: 2-C-methyl-D-erythritol 2,4-cyclodiphosphate synthase, partial [Chloroflexota bacterium]|nr:2-C-methyl-D-erythritol 2,4-cyclodiphosphate synthase [Chloroflexota bacterium]